MAVRILRKKLSKEQIAEGIIYTSTLSKYRFETPETTTHEIREGDENITEKMCRLEDTKFFRDSPYKFNIVRTK